MDNEALMEDWDSKIAGIAGIAGIAVATGKNEKSKIAGIAGIAVAFPDKPKSIIKSESHNEAYPVDALPPLLGGAVSDAFDYMQAPVSLIAASALSSISLIGQGLVDVKRDAVLRGATSLNTMVVVESGERKSAVDKLMNKPIKEADKAASSEIEELMKRYALDREMWDEIKKAKLSQLKSTAKNPKKSKDDLAEIKDELSRLQDKEPNVPVVQSMLYESFSLQSLADGMDKGYPSAGVFSDEGGTVLGGYAMQGDNVSSTLGFINKLWDGAGYKHRTRGFGDVTIHDRRLSVSLAVQSSILQTFFDGAKGNARGSGFLARFLISRPSSTQGTRLYKEPQAMPLLDAYHSKINDLLNQPLTINDYGGVSPVELSLSASAKGEWIRFYNDVERELKPFKDMADIKDVASKAGENAARMAALFHLVKHGDTGSISQETMESAAVLMGWYLYEAKTFYSGIDTPDYIQNAIKLDAWLVAHCKDNQVSEVRRLHVLQYSPIRKAKQLDEVLAVLDEKNRIQEYKADGVAVYIAVHPDLLGANHGP